MREELYPVYVNAPATDVQHTFGQRILEHDTLQMNPDPSVVQSLQSRVSDLKGHAETYLSQVLRQVKQKLATDRTVKTEQELQRLDDYAASEREQLKSFIEQYREKQEAGKDMEIAIRGQEKRLESLQQRIERRKENVHAKAQVISLAPELVNTCFVVPS